MDELFGPENCHMVLDVVLVVHMFFDDAMMPGLLASRASWIVIEKIKKKV